MALTVTHALSATTPDDPGYEIRPSHWNSSHVVVGPLVDAVVLTGNTAGAMASISSGTLVLAGGNNITLSQNANSVTISGPTTVAQSVQPVAASGSNGSFNFSTITFGASNGLSFYTTNGSMVGSYTVPNVPSQTVESNTFGMSNLGNTSGTSGVVSGGQVRVLFAGGNNITLSQSINGSSATITISGVNTVAQSVQPVAASGSNGSFNFSTITFGNLNGISFYTSNGSMVASHTVPTQTVQPVAASGSNGSFLFSTITFGDLNGITHYTTNGSLVASYNPPSFIQSDQTLGIYATENTTQSSSGTYDARSLTVRGAGAASVGMSNGSLIISAPSAAAGNVTFSAGTASAGLASLVFSNSNGVSFGLNGSTITGSVNAGGGGVAIANSQTTYTSGTANFLEGGGAITIASSAGGQSLKFSVPQTSSLVGVNNISISTNGSTISISGLQNTSRFAWPMLGNFSALAAMGNGSLSLQRMQVENGFSATRMEVPFLVSLASSAAANTWGLAVTVFGGIYTKNANTLSSLSSASTSFSISLASNTAGSTHVIPHAIRPLTLPITVQCSNGEYYVGFGVSTNTSSIGTATTALGNTWSVMGGIIYTSAVPQVSFFNNTTNTSTNIWGGHGIYSAAVSSFVPAVSLSAINQTGSYYGRANFGVIFRNQ